MEKNTHIYDDIIALPHPTSRNHPRMTPMNRAAQFAPFAALSGHKEATLESERITQQKRILDENAKALLDETMQDIQLHIKQHPFLKVTYFKKDATKEGGAYLTLKQAIKKIDEYHQTIQFMDSTILSIEDIYAIEKTEEESE